MEWRNNTGGMTRVSLAYQTLFFSEILYEGGSKQWIQDLGSYTWNARILKITWVLKKISSWHFQKGADSEKRHRFSPRCPVGWYFSAASFHLLRTGGIWGGMLNGATNQNIFRFGAILIPFSNALVYQRDPSCLGLLYAAKNYPVPVTYIGLSQGVLNTAQMCTRSPKQDDSPLASNDNMKKGLLLV